MASLFIIIVPSRAPVASPALVGRAAARARRSSAARHGPATAVAAATTRAVTAEAGMTQSRFHYCFRSKAELLHEVVETMVSNQVTSVLDAVRAGVGGDVRSGLHTALQAYCQHLGSIIPNSIC